LISYYRGWSEQDAAAAPRYVYVAGVGGVEEIRDKVFTALG